MRTIFRSDFAKGLCLSLLILFSSRSFAAGYQTLKLPAASGVQPIDVVIWSPCAAAPNALQLGPYLVQATKNCAIAGSSLPLIVVSHGQGGSYLGHHDTATELANAGFLVVSLNHPGDCFGDDSEAQKLRIFESRPRDVSRVISYMLTDWPNRKLLNPNAIGVFGFSRGGYTALALAGATPDTAASAARFCDAWWSFVIALCRQLDSDSAQISPQPDPRVRAVVVVDPLNLFDAAGVSRVRIPVQLWASERGGDGVELGHVEAIRKALPQPVEYRVARGAGHFAFLAPCPAEFKSSEPRLCQDPDGFDREAWHRSMNAAVVLFFQRQL